MRIHGVHVQGIHAPRGEHRIAFDPGSTVVLTRDGTEARSLLALLDVLLYPGRDPASLSRWAHPDKEQPARAGLSISFGPDAYRVIVDFKGCRLLLGRFDAAAKEYRRISTDPDEIAASLAVAGLPVREQFLRLHVWDPYAAAAAPLPAPGPEADVDPATDTHTSVTPPFPPPAPPSPEPAAPERADERGELAARARELRQARDRFVRLEREEKQVASELAQRAILADLLDDLDARVRRFTEHTAIRARELERVEGTRRSLLDERSRLRKIPAAQVSGMWLGVAIGTAGALAGTLIQPILYLLGLAGVGTALFGLIVARTAQRRLGAVEARLAALRVRECAAERSYESETAQFRGLMRELDLESADEIQRVATDYRGLLRRSEMLKVELEEARRAFPEEAEAELRVLEERLERGPPAAPDGAPPGPVAEDGGEPPTAPSPPQGAPHSRAPLPSPEPGEPAPPPSLALALASGERALDELVETAALESDRSEAEIRESLGPVLPIYLRALTAGMYTRVWHRPGEGWLFRRGRQGERVTFEGLALHHRLRLALAFRLAILEALAPGLRLPLLVGPDLLPADASPEERQSAARSLARLSGALQVIHLSVEESPWSDQADAVQRLSR